ncbi:MAG: helix-turn-helix domain-containing protein [Phycisphaera sp.]|nr:helix-turn-helix domain-containing protein [Phycisphaera sp.]
MAKRLTMTEALRQQAKQAEGVRALARAAGVDPMTVSHFLAGKRSIRLDSADKLAAVLGVEVRITKRK